MLSSGKNCIVNSMDVKMHFMLYVIIDTTQKSLCACVCHLKRGWAGGRERVGVSASSCFDLIVWRVSGSAPAVGWLPLDTRLFLSRCVAANLRPPTTRPTRSAMSTQRCVCVCVWRIFFPVVNIGCEVPNGGSGLLPGLCVCTDGSVDWCVCVCVY